MNNSKNIFSHLGSDLPSGLVVFLVALPLCLGIALSSGAPLFSGIIAGIVGGIVVGYLSGSSTSVSGPAAGLTVIVLNAIADLGAFDIFLLSVVLAGVFQIILGVAKAGIIGYYFPTSVIKGMLAGIGIILIIKQIPYAFGVNETQNLAKYIPFVNDWEAVMDLRNLANEFDFGALIITIISLTILILWDKPFIKRNKVLKVIPGPLLVVILGVAINKFFKFFVPNLYLDFEDKVILPKVQSWDGFTDLFMFPDFTAISNPDVWVVAFTIAIIASLETLLSLEAADKIDPYKRVSPPNRELFAQGTGNIVNGLVGGLPVTAVIVRSSANVTSGARTKMSAIFHGLLLVLSVLLIPSLLNLIPLACLAAILLQVGYKLAKISLFKTQARLGWDQFLPFVITILGIVIFDLLIGIGLGMGVAIVYILLRNFQNSHVLSARENVDSPDTLRIILSEEVSFLNKGSLIKTLDEIPDGKHVIIDGSNSKIIDYDVLEVIENFRINAKERGIEVDTIKIKSVKVGGVH
ncbi:sulfate permease-like transporter, MFS superfamily [Belliella baltica DSM 15883]|uniref:Sulfate permease-like transporter, MFS superfamily n=1 Tax=Belliella baltica (strain DSM 15883 / CIP 108006 / LMG 21964 / BA134) TaxID=866536 RepID=I3ZA95_BELBD|nr:SulP family inorganic anion transporter [Belliella baltica]AFL86163.1 sulfate permease-like transporter, MFS superfamily [Belliella baltica DSM 15883]